MATVFIPSLMRSLSSGMDRVEIEGATVRQIVKNLDDMFPGMQDRLMENGRLKSLFSVAVDGEVSQLGALEKVQPNSEVHFLNAIAGG